MEVTHFTDPGCPWAYSAWPAHTTLRWRYGQQLRWTVVMIGLTALFRFTRVGLAMRASAFSQEVSRLLGVRAAGRRSPRVPLVAFWQ